jgi:HU domain fused to wHTH, Ig, or Glycine-rich motif
MKTQRKYTPQKRKAVTFKKLIEVVAESCKYHQYEVEDVLVHLSKVLQKILVEEKSVRLTGLGKINMKKLTTRSTKDKDVWYDTFRLSVQQDTAMKEYLKENYGKSTDLAS